MGTWPAIDVHASRDTDLVLAAVDEFSPTAVEERGDRVRVFFAGNAARGAARSALTAAGFCVAAIDVPDEDWARRSQQKLGPITVGRLTLYPGPEPRGSSPDAPDLSRQPPVTVVISPSMGFGTGHHASTRLCLAALQTIDLAHAFVLDVGTGSGVLALAAVRLGAARALGIDRDADAIQSARENLALNPGARQVEFEVADLVSASLPQADVVTANLSGALLVRVAARLQHLLGPSGSLIISGFETEEREGVRAAFGTMIAQWASEEEGWVGLRLRAVD